MPAKPTKMKFDPDVYARMLEQPEPALDDPNNPEWTEDDFSHAKGPESLPPEVLAAFPNTVARLRGRQKTPTKTQVALRLDPDIVAHFKAGGRGWHSRINAALREAMAKG
ncbi:MAG: BrnA antitoxin family protein [Caulobacteraceae bacterium]